jgi:hypothetical protein
MPATVGRHRAPRELHQACRTGVHHSRVAQHVEHLLGALDGARGGVQHGVHDLVQVRARHRLRGLGHHPDHGQHGALDGLADGPVGGIRGGPQRAGEQRLVHLAGRAHDICEAGHDLRQDDPAVAGGAGQRRALGGQRQLLPVMRGRALQPGSQLGRSLGQVGAGVAVGHRVHVQVVQAGGRRLDGRRASLGERERDVTGTDHGPAGHLRALDALDVDLE